MSDQDMLFQRREQPAPSNNQPAPNPSNGGKKASKIKGPSKKWLKIIIAVVVLAVIGTGGYLGYTKYNNLKKENAKLSNPQEAARAETESLKSEVAKAIELPNENPTIATVVDASKLKSQSFFTNAQNGDKVLLFTQAKKAVLYRPSTKKVIEVAPINIGNNSTKTP